MYGRVFESMYEGSMMGVGATVYAVWTYVIVKMRKDSEVGAQVELNPKLLAVMIGEREEVIAKAIAKLCAPDPNSRTPDNDGRRLVKLGQFSYQVVNGKKYLEINNLEQKRSADRNRKRRQRAGQAAARSTPLPGEQAYVEALNRGDEAGANKILDGLNQGKLKHISPSVERNDDFAQQNGVTTQLEPSPRGTIETPERVEIPEIPVSGQSLAHGTAPSKEEPAESGKWVDGEWVPD